MGVQVESGGVVRNEETNDSRSTNIEEQDTDVDALNGTREIAARVFGFTGGDGDDFRSDEGERCLSLRHSQWRCVKG